MYVRGKNSRHLKHGDGMSAGKSTIAQRAEVIERIYDAPAPDCIKYGFYISDVWMCPVADYNGNEVTNEINLGSI